MGIMKKWRLHHFFRRSWRDAGKIAHYPDVQKSRLSLFLDILSCFRKYYVFSNQYKNQMIWTLPKEERDTFCYSIGKDNHERDEWFDDYYENRRFLNKYTSRKYETSPKLIRERRRAYTKRYHLGKNCSIQFNVEFSREHLLNGTLNVGNDVLFAKNVFIDYSGELIIHDGVAIANGVVIETHTHPLEENRQKPLPGRLEIGDCVKILSNSYIADTCHSIGRYARIGAGSYVRTNIPPYAIVMGNPAKIIGFLYSPEEMLEFEKTRYIIEERTPIDSYKKQYEKYFRKRSKEIRDFIKL